MHRHGSRLRFAHSLTLAALSVGAPLAAGACASDVTVFSDCQGGTTPCGEACVDLLDDPAHCGGCGQACPAGEVCSAGVCAAACGAGLTACGGSCVDTSSDPEHCGACDAPCNPGASCASGQCGAGCAPPLADCGGSCVNPQTDPQHCGGCFTPCPAGQACAGGACQAGCGPLTMCGGVCVDTTTDPQHCGGCDLPCAIGESCVAGACDCFAGAVTDLGSTVPATASGDTAGAPNAVEPSCVPAGSGDAVFSFTAPAAGAYTFDTFGSGYDTALVVLAEQGCDELGCNDDAGGVQSEVTLDLAQGETVLVVVDGFGGDEGPFQLHVTQATAPMCPTGSLGAAVPQSVTGSTVGLGDAGAPGCTFSTSGDASYTFTAPATGDYVFDTAGSAFEAVVHVHDGGCAGPEIACDATAPGASAAVPLVQGQSVVVFVDGVGAAEGTYVLSVDQLAPPNCPALMLGATVPQAVTGTTIGAPNSVSAPCGSANGADVTYAFTAPAGGVYTFDTFGSGFDTVLHVHDGSCAGPSLACNDDTSGLQSQVTVPLAAGQAVVVVVDGYNTAAGAYTLNVAQTSTATCPAGTLGSTVPQTITGTTAGASVYAPATCNGGAGPETHFAFTAPAAGTYTLDTFGSGFDTVLYVRDGTCSGPEIACNDDTSGLQSQVVLTLAAGQTVVVFVDGYNGGAQGGFTLHVL